MITNSKWIKNRCKNTNLFDFLVVGFDVSIPGEALLDPELSSGRSLPPGDVSGRKDDIVPLPPLCRRTSGGGHDVSMEALQADFTPERKKLHCRSLLH